MREERNTVLDLCGGSGAWSRPWRDAGYGVIVITLPGNDVTRVEFGDCGMSFRDCASPDPLSVTTVLYSELYGVLAAPPCTEFSVAKGSRPRDLKNGMVTVRACMEIIWRVQEHVELGFWALENPRGLLRRFLGRPAMTFEHWQFGGDMIKPTDLWGRFASPDPAVRTRPALPMYVGNPHGSDRWLRVEAVTGGGYMSKSFSDPKTPDWCREYIADMPPSERRAALRAITPAGFAEAFFKANRRR